jgi:hypothetical protein
MGTDTTITIPVPERVFQDPDLFRSYLTEYILLDLRLQLEEARKQAGLTEKALARKLHWKVRKIRQCETDWDTSVTLEDYIRWLVACGVLPVPGDLIALEHIRAQSCRVLESPQTLGLVDDS